MTLAQALVFSFQWMILVLTVFQVPLAQQADGIGQFTHIVTALPEAFDVLLKLGSKCNLAHGYKPR